MIQKTVLLLYLMINAWKDWTTRKISLISFFVCLAINMCVTILQKQTFGERGLYGWIPGFVLGTISVVTRGQIGFGDALVIGITGWITGWREVIWILLWAWMGAAFYGGILFLKKRKERIPFIPFVLIGYVMELILNTWMR